MFLPNLQLGISSFSDILRACEMTALPWLCEIELEKDTPYIKMKRISNDATIHMYRFDDIWGVLVSGNFGIADYILYSIECHKYKLVSDDELKLLTLQYAPAFEQLRQSTYVSLKKGINDIFEQTPEEIQKFLNVKLV
jgi:hypothetical protein